MSQSATQVHREALQRQTQQDWANREYIELISGSIKRIADFLNAFDMSCRSRLSTLNEKLTTLERKIDYLEGKTRVSQDIEAEEEALAQQQQGHETAEMMPPPPPPPMMN
jgi:uncharacterized protein